ncbi:MAG: hypothetical protein Q8K75_05260 [Chlamydiales bacterium]|nr:hypothetical protein [Chlamydiales bacterium]
MEGAAYLAYVPYLGMPETTYRDPKSHLPVLGLDVISTDTRCDAEIVWLLNQKIRGCSGRVIATNIINIAMLRPNCVSLLNDQEKKQLFRITVKFINWHQASLRRARPEGLEINS